MLSLVRVRIANIGSKKNSRRRKKSLLNRIGAKVETSKNNRIQKAKNKNKNGKS
jgi:hypothetical protein